MGRISKALIIVIVGISTTTSVMASIYNVTDCDATGNGSTLDTDAINAAVANANGGRVVYFPDG